MFLNDCLYSETKSHINTDEDTRIVSTDTMKILGFVFATRPNVSAHVDYTIKKFNRAIWSLTHLRKAGIQRATLVTVYCTMLRPIIEFCSPVYYPMLTAEQNNKLEYLQKMALKIIFGFNINYETLLEKASIVSLEERRKEAFSKFARSISKNPRYEPWFPPNLNRRTRSNE